MIVRDLCYRSQQDSQPTRQPSEMRVSVREAGRPRRLLGCMEIRRNTAEKQVMEGRWEEEMGKGGKARRGRKKGREGESGAAGLDNEQSDEKDRAPNRDVSEMEREDKNLDPGKGTGATIHHHNRNNSTTVAAAGDTQSPPACIAPSAFSRDEVVLKTCSLCPSPSHKHMGTSLCQCSSQNT
ncbi:hypothetical protein JOB18_023282 [Solea senegalensis]|uniref:Uncharacterized protein n=1 Tax=Solea senegalensis TaxID=28829 RepID=A0AAV6RKN8_SOLSE|nr:hypothetical protein JOB18_023282 [Solea senegalensis]